MRVHLDRGTPWRETLRPKGTEVAIEQKRLQQLAGALLEDMDHKYGPEAELTAVLAIAAVKKSDGSAYIQYRAADRDGVALAPWHVNGILRYVLSYTEAQTP